MANEQLTIGQDKARLSVIGKSWPNMNFDSGIGLDLSQIIFDILIDLDIPMPDIDFDDLDDIIIIPGLDIDTEIPTLEYPDPDWPDYEIPPILDWSMPDLNWDDFIDKLEDLGIDPNILIDLSFVGLNDLEIPELVFLDEDFNIQMDELPASIEIVTPPNKLEYQDGERIDLTGMVVTAKKTDGSTWTSAKYPNGHIPLGELIIEPTQADINQANDISYSSDLDTSPVPNPVPVVNKFETEYSDPQFDYKYIGEISGIGGFFSVLDHGDFTVNSGRFLIASETRGGSSIYFHHGFGPTYDTSQYRWHSTYGPYTYKGKSVYYYNGGLNAQGTKGWPIGVIIGGEITKPGPVAWTMVYGKAVEGDQEISVLWPRYGDGEELQTSFLIEVKDSPGGGGR